jgi:4-amino-4-deoxy-L-arabinose transferase-like glycosyltransferase
MKKINQIKSEWPIILLTLFLLIVYIGSISKVPFHPDESTFIYMSDDLKILFSNPLSLSYSPDQPSTNKDIYRAIDAPLSRYLIGLSRMFFNSPDQDNDWDWSRDWQFNTSNGALPTSRHLFASRFLGTLFVPIAILLFYFTVRRVLPNFSAVFASIYLGLHPLILLHTRRAMSEAFLFFGIILFLWSITRKKRNPWLIGIALAIAVNTKQTALALLPVGIIAVCYREKSKVRLKELLLKITKLMLVLILISLFLNPFYWKNPIQAVRFSIQSRQAVLQNQMLDHLSGNNYPLHTKTLSIIANLHILPPSFEETANYIKETEPSKSVYLNNPLSSWGRNLIAGAIFITLSAGGFIMTCLNYKKFKNLERYFILQFFLTSILLYLTIAIFLPLPWQRYVLPLLPLTAFWAGIGIKPFKIIFSS